MFMCAVPALSVVLEGLQSDSSAGVAPCWPVQRCPWCWRVSSSAGVSPCWSVEPDLQVLSVLAEELAVVVVHGPEGGEVARLHAGQEVLPPAPLQLHEAPEAPLGVAPHHLQAVGDVGLVQDPSGERRGEETRL